MKININARKFKNIKNVSKEEWLKLRQKGIGGSDVAGLLNLNKRFTSPLKVYLSKVEEVDLTDEINDAMYFGNELEDIVAKTFVNRVKGFKAQKTSFMWQHPEHDFMLANVDRFIYHPDHGWGVLECKTTNEFRKGEFDGEEIPEPYLLQVLHYLAITGLSYGYLAVLIGGQTFRYFRVERDEEIIDMLINLEADFWTKHVAAGVPPVIDGSEASAKVMDALYPAEKVEKESLIALPDTASMLIKQYEDAKEKENQFKEMKEEAKSKLKDMVGTHHKGMILDRVVRWSPVKASKKFDQKAFEKDHPELAAEYKKYGKPSRRFTIS